MTLFLSEKKKKNILVIFVLYIITIISRLTNMHSIIEKPLKDEGKTLVDGFFYTILQDLLLFLFIHSFIFFII